MSPWQSETPSPSMVTQNGQAAATVFAPVDSSSSMANGIDANGICRSIRGSEEFETVKIIALANHLSEQEAGALMQKGFDGYVSNPSDDTEVVHKIEEATAIIY